MMGDEPDMDHLLDAAFFEEGAAEIPERPAVIGLNADLEEEIARDADRAAEVLCACSRLGQRKF